jgi:hypothetical protein
MLGIILCLNEYKYLNHQEDVWQVSPPRNLPQHPVQNVRAANRYLDMTSPKEYILVLEASVSQW